MQTRLPPLESLRVFEACARHCNFSRAASELGVTPTAVSLRVRQLERQLEVRLFARSGPRISLTAQGSALGSRMSEIMALARAAVGGCRGDLQPIRVTAAPTFAARWLAPRLGSWNAVEGASPIRLHSSSALDPADGFDIAVRSGAGPWPGLETVRSVPIERTPMLHPSLAAGAALRVPADLLRLPLLKDDCWQRWLAGVGVTSADLRTGLVEYPTQDLAAAAAVEGAGVALLSPALFGSLLAEGKLVQPFDHVLRGPAAYHVLRHRSEARPAVLRFCQWLADELST